jgi:aspartate/methionine/tyrosine aminotransferase
MGRSIYPETEIVVTCGSTEAMMAAMTLDLPTVLLRVPIM